MSIEQAFLSGATLYLKNCHQMDSLLYPLAQWKSTSQRTTLKDGLSLSLLTLETKSLSFSLSLSVCLASNLILYCGRRLFCHPAFRFLLHTDTHSFEQVSPALLLMCTPINCQLTVETYLDDLRQKIFQRVQPKFYQQKLALLNLILQCQQRIQAIDLFLKTNSIRFVLLLGHPPVPSQGTDCLQHCRSTRISLRQHSSISSSPFFQQCATQ